jgi:hypothetical protein
MIGGHDLRVSTLSCCPRQLPHRRFSASVSSEDRASSRVAVLTRGHCSERFCAGNLAQRRVWGKRAPSSSRAPSVHEQRHRHREAQRGRVRGDAWPAMHRVHLSCEHARGIPLGTPSRTAMTYGTIGVAPSGPRQRKIVFNLCGSRARRIARRDFKADFCRRRCEAPLRTARNLRVAQVLHKLTEGLARARRSLHHFGSDARPDVGGTRRETPSQVSTCNAWRCTERWFAQTWPAHAPAAIVRHRMS